jgi:anthranilate synthase component 1
MEIIDELEPSKRGIYGGACGYLELCRRHGRGHRDPHRHRQGRPHLYVQAAAGMVADSVPEMEWQETEHKARALSAPPSWSRRASMTRFECRRTTCCS